MLRPESWSLVLLSSRNAVLPPPANSGWRGGLSLLPFQGCRTVRRAPPVGHSIHRGEATPTPPPPRAPPAHPTKAIISTARAHLKPRAVTLQPACLPTGFSALTSSNPLPPPTIPSPSTFATAARERLRTAPCVNCGSRVAASFHTGSKHVKTRAWPGGWGIEGGRAGVFL